MYHNVFYTLRRSYHHTVIVVMSLEQVICTRGLVLLTFLPLAVTVLAVIGVFIVAV